MSLGRLRSNMNFCHAGVSEEKHMLFWKIHDQIQLEIKKNYPLHDNKALNFGT